MNKLNRFKLYFSAHISFLLQLEITSVYMHLHPLPLIKTNVVAENAIQGNEPTNIFSEKTFRCRERLATCHGLRLPGHRPDRRRIENWTGGPG